METSLSKIDHYHALQRLEMCVQMFDSQMARNCEELEIDKVVLPAIFKAQKDLGLNPNEEKTNHLMTGIANEIKRSVPNIRLAEIPIAINDGILGVYGDFMSLSVVTVIKFLKAHYNASKRAEIAKQVQQKEEEREPPPIEEQKRIAKGHLIEEFEKYKKTKTTSISSVYLYRFLSEHFGLGKFSKEIKFKMFYDAAKVIVKNLKNEIMENPNARLTNSRKIVVLENFFAIEDDPLQCGIAIFKGLQNEELKIQIKNESERIALRKFFDDLIEIEQSIEELLNDK